MRSFKWTLLHLLQDDAAMVHLSFLILGSPRVSHRVKTPLPWEWRSSRIWTKAEPALLSDLVYLVLGSFPALSTSPLRLYSEVRRSTGASEVNCLRRHSPSALMSFVHLLRLEPLFFSSEVPPSNRRFRQSLPRWRKVARQPLACNDKNTGSD